MKVLIYSHTFAPNVGGAETYVMLLARGLCDGSRTEKMCVTVATPTPANGFDDAALPFTVVRRAGIAGVAKLIRHADVVSLAGPVFAPLLFCKLFRKPVVVEHHNYPPICPNGSLLVMPDKTVCPGHFMRGEYRACLKCNASVVGWTVSLKKLLLTWPRRWLCRLASVNLCITQHVANRLQLPRSTVVYYGIPDAQIITTPNGRAVFAYVGRFVSEKGLPLLIEAAQILDRDGVSFQLLMIGDGPERAALEQQAEAFGLRDKIQFTGFLRGKDLDAAVENVSAVIMPSICEETAGLSAMEQMMRGRPVIVSDIGGLAEVTGDGGLKFSPGDAGELAQCMQLLVEDPRFLAELGGRAKERASKLFTQNRMVEEHLNIFRSVLTGAAI